jgi:hypothetical protein
VGIGSGSYPETMWVSTVVCGLQGLTPNLMMLGREIRLPYELTTEGKGLNDSANSVQWSSHVLKIR